jgi:hypothetical protein
MLTITRRSRDAVYRRYRELGQQLWAKYRQKIVAAHPDTDGNLLCIRNWGNDEAKSLLEKYEAINRRLTKRATKEYNLADHLGHHNQKPHRFQPMWCLYCQDRSKTSRRNFLRDYPAVAETYYPVHVVEHLLHRGEQP